MLIPDPSTQAGNSMSPHPSRSHSFENDTLAYISIIKKICIQLFINVKIETTSYHSPLEEKFLLPHRVLYGSTLPQF